MDKVTFVAKVELSEQYAEAYRYLQRQYESYGEHGNRALVAGIIKAGIASGLSDFKDEYSDLSIPTDEEIEECVREVVEATKKFFGEDYDAY